MKAIPILVAALTVLSVITVVGYSCGDSKNDGYIPGLEGTQSGAFLSHRDSVPSQEEYPYSLFVLSHDYPSSLRPVINPSWRKALKGASISNSNVFAYMDALKKYIAPNLLPFFTHPKSWSAAANGWFHEPWLGSEREAILGAYQGNGNPANMFKSLKEDESGYVLTLYDSTAAFTVGQIWGTTGQAVNLVNDAAQFKEGSVIVKLAFSNINYPNWPVMKGAQVFSIYDTVPTRENPEKGYHIRRVSFFQMDVIVKDSLTAPKTGWVYSTFVYDSAAIGSVWEKMVPLGAMWGNDPGVNSPLTPPFPELYETVINPDAPYYSTETLGWGGRLSGPNDGAVVQEAYDITTRQKYTNLALSSCMGCHSPSQDNFNSFLLPAPFPGDTFFVYTPGSSKWNLWFRDDYGTVPFDKGQTSLDYDMVMAFKSIPNFKEAQHSASQNKLLKSNLDAARQFRRHNSKSKFWH
jgi:hypothetical protein